MFNQNSIIYEDQYYVSINGLEATLSRVRPYTYNYRLYNTTKCTDVHRRSDAHSIKIKSDIVVK